MNSVEIHSLTNGAEVELSIEPAEQGYTITHRLRGTETWTHTFTCCGQTVSITCPTDSSSSTCNGWGSPPSISCS